MRLHLNEPIPSFSPMAIDIETSGLDPYLDRLLSVAISNGEDVWIWLDIHGFDAVKELLRDESIIKVAHNAKFEYKWFLHKLGVRMNNLFDTQLAEDTIYKGYKWEDYPRSLEWVLARRMSVAVDKSTREEFFNHPGFAVRPVTNEQLEYMMNDVIYLQKVMEQQIQEAENLGLIPTFTLENACVPATAELELNGVTLDVDLWFKQIEQIQKLVDKYALEAREVIGEDKIVVEYKNGPREFSANDINFNSNPQVTAVYNQIFDADIRHPKTKKQSTSADWVLIPMLEKGMLSERCADFTRKLLLMREWRDRKRIRYEKHIHPVTGKVHTEFKQDGTDTGRYSSANPNMQNIPRPVEDKSIPNLRNIWVADSEEYVIIRADYSQQEPRILGQILGLPDVIRACNTKDVYLGVGELIFGKKLTKKDEERHLCKTAMLGKSYGQGLPAFCAKIGKDIVSGKEIYDKIESAFPVDAFAEDMRKQAAKYGYVTTLNGRRRNFDYTKFIPYNEPLNTPVQGTAADMFKLALVKVHNTLTEMKSCGKLDNNTRVWNLVHDEMEVHCHKDEVDIVLPLVKQLMEDAGHEICPDVTHIAEAEYGYRWDK